MAVGRAWSNNEPQSFNTGFACTARGTATQPGPAVEAPATHAGSHGPVGSQAESAGGRGRGPQGCPGRWGGGSAVASGLHVDDLADGLACAVDRGRGGRFCRGGRRCRAAAVLVAIVVLDARNLGILGLALHLRGQGRTDGRHVHETPCGGGGREGLGSQLIKIVGGREIFRGAGLVGGLRHTRVDASSLPRHGIASCRGDSPQPAAAACPAASVDLYQAAQRRARLRMPCASRQHRGGASPRSWPVRVAARCRRER